MTKAVAVLKGDSGAGGVVTFEQTNPVGGLTVTGDLTGLDASALRGFHIQCVPCPGTTASLMLLINIYMERLWRPL